MKKAVSVFLFFCMYVLFVDAQGFGDIRSFNNDWRFNLGDIKYGGKEYMDISNWQKVELPHDWTVLQTASPQYAACTGFLPGGIGWYRKEFDIPEKEKGKKVYIYFEGVYNNSEVFVNGKFLGKRPNGYISFMYDLTPYLKYDRTNTVAVRVDRTKDADSRWYTGGGIYRNVKLVFADPVHIDLWGVFCSSTLSKDLSNADIDAQTTIDNQTDRSVSVNVVQELYDPENRKTASGSKQVMIPGKGKEAVNIAFKITDPKLWGTDAPNLYRLKTIVYKNGNKIDETFSTVGIRSLRFDPDTGFYLNGKSMKMKGVCIHHDAGSLGAAVPKSVWTYRLRQLKEIGCNAIRMSHNPESPELFDACDEEGLLVMAEAYDEWEYPKKKWLVGWNVGEPGFQGSADYFREWNKRDLKDMILRDRNHPSIVMWSIGNEVDYPNDPYSHPILDKEGIGQAHERGYLTSQPRAERLGDIAKELVEVVKQYDMSRPVTAALAGAVMSNATDYPGALDIVGYNYTEDRYQIDHRAYPKRVLYGSENRHDFDAWKAVRDNKFIFAQFLWTGFDYLGEAGVWPSRGFTTGLIDLAGNIKPRGYYREALWSEKPFAYIGTYPENTDDPFSIDAPAIWNYETGQNIRVVCYMNAEEAQLFLNGKLTGSKQKYNDNTGVVGWTIPFEEGILEVKAYNDGKLAANYRVETSGRPYALEAEILSKTDTFNQIMIRVVDENGKFVPLADNEIILTCSGNRQLIATENGKSDAADNYRDNRHRVYNGKLLVYLKTTEGREGELKASSDLLKGITVKF